MQSPSAPDKKEVVIQNENHFNSSTPTTNSYPSISTPTSDAPPQTTTKTNTQFTTESMPNSPLLTPTKSPSFLGKIWQDSQAYFSTQGPRAEKHFYEVTLNKSF